MHMQLYISPIPRAGQGEEEGRPRDGIVLHPAPHSLYYYLVERSASFWYDLSNSAAHAPTALRPTMDAWPPSAAGVAAGGRHSVPVAYTAAIASAASPYLRWPPPVHRPAPWLSRLADEQPQG